MPVYEFYCPDCNTIFSFLSRGVNTGKIPPCPGNTSHRLDKKVSMFAALSGMKTKGSDDTGVADGGGMDDLPIDEAKMGKAVEALAGEADGMSEEDPRAAARLMRKFSDMTGLQFKGKFEEALTRMESGEDPEALEAELGDSLEGDEMPFELPSKKATPGSRARRAAPQRDQNLYEM